MTTLKQISTTLDSLAKQAEQLDTQRGEHHKPLFDEQLFHCRAKKLLPCVLEAKASFEHIYQHADSCALSAEQAESAADTLIAQLEAIQRELATQSIRAQEPKHAMYTGKSIKQLYQERSQHQEWTRRLRELVAEKQQQLNSAPASQYKQHQQALLQAEQRLKRCLDAQVKLDKYIAFKEKNPQR